MHGSRARGAEHRASSSSVVGGGSGLVNQYCLSFCKELTSTLLPSRSMDGGGPQNRIGYKILYHTLSPYRHCIYPSCPPSPSLPEKFNDTFIYIFHCNGPLIVPSRRTIGTIHTTQSRHVTGSPNPSADYFLVVIGEVSGHDRQTMAGWPMQRGSSYVSLQIARVEFDFPATYSGDGRRNDSHGVVSSCKMGGGRAALFWAAEAIEYALCLRQIPSICGWLAHPSWLHHFLVVPCLMKTPPLVDPYVHPLWLQHLVLATDP